jgi:hypothetical protein
MFSFGSAPRLYKEDLRQPRREGEILCGGGVEYLHRAMRDVGGDETGTQCLGV